MKRFKVDDIHTRTARALWAMRTAPSSVDGRTPADVMGRSFRTHLTQLHPGQQPTPTPSSVSPARQPGEMVWVLKRSLNQADWVPGLIIQSRGARCFDVLLESGSTMKNVSGDHLRLRFGKEVETEDNQGSNRNDSFQPVTRTPSLCSLPGVPRATAHLVTPTMASEIDAPRQNFGDSTEEERSEATTHLDTSRSHVNVEVEPSSNTETSTENVTAGRAPPSMPENGATGNEQVLSPTVSGTSTTQAPATALASLQPTSSRALVVDDGIALPGVVPESSASHSAIPSVSAPAAPFYGFPEERVQQPSSSRIAERPTCELPRAPSGSASPRYFESPELICPTLRGVSQMYFCGARLLQ